MPPKSTRKRKAEEVEKEDDQTKEETKEEQKKQDSPKKKGSSPKKNTKKASEDLKSSKEENKEKDNKEKEEKKEKEEESKKSSKKEEENGKKEEEEKKEGEEEESSSPKAKRPAKRRRVGSSRKSAKKKKPADPNKPPKPKASSSSSGTKKITKKNDHRLTVSELPSEMKEHFNWRELSIIGIEEGAEEEIHKKKWEFPELQEALSSGFLSKKSYPLYLFMGAQPVSQGASNVFNVPYIIVLDCKAAMGDFISLTSIQSAKENIIPMKAARVGWAPYRPKGFRDRPELPAQFFYLSMERRRSVREKLTAERLHSLSFLLPYELLPQVFEERDIDKECENVRTVSFVYKTKAGKNVEFNWDKDIHFLSQGDLKMMMEEDKIPEEEYDAVKKALADAFKEKREQLKKEYNATKEILDKYTEERKEALRSLKIYKFYPTCPGTNIKSFIVPDVNRYFGKAHEVFPKVEEKEEKKKEKEEEK